MIEREEDGTRGRHVRRRDGAEAELTFARPRPGLRVADRTFVPEALRGGGVAAALTERMARDARAEGRRIRPVCPYTEHWRRRHPEWADVFEG